jgi:hypothetical protein
LPSLTALGATELVKSPRRDLATSNQELGSCPSSANTAAQARV